MSALSMEEAAALAEQGLAAQRAGNAAGALDLYLRAEAPLAAVPELHNNLALCHLDLGRPELAEAPLRRAVALRPGYAEAWGNLGLVLQRLKRVPEAAQAYARALEADPAYVTATFNLGALFLEEGRAAEAEAMFSRALRLPGVDAVKAVMNLGLARLEQRDAAGALALYEQARAEAPDDAELASNQAIARLLSGDWERGWEEYEARWRLPGHAPLSHAMPRWRGEDLAGKGLLLWTEQGAGTSIQFLRYAAPLAARGARITVACEPPLRRLAAAAAGVSAVVERGEGAGCDFHLPLVSAASMLQTRVDSVPPPARFLLPAAPGPEGRARIGLVWSGNPAFAQNGRRSVPLRELAPLARVPGLSWAALQQGAAGSPEERAAWPSDGPVLAPPPAFADFYETALALREIDLLVTTDTAIAHLAGSLGKPVALLLMAVPDWRWLLSGETTPWYPSARLFRQAEAGRWADPVAALARRLQAWRDGAPW